MGVKALQMRSPDMAATGLAAQAITAKLRDSEPDKNAALRMET